MTKRGEGRQYLKEKIHSSTVEDDQTNKTHFFISRNINKAKKP